MKRAPLLALLLFALTGCPRGHGKYLIEQTQGRAVMQYRTNQFKKVGPCILFLVDADSVGLCGRYTITVGK